VPLYDFECDGASLASAASFGNAIVLKAATAYYQSGMLPRENQIVR